MRRSILAASGVIGLAVAAAVVVGQTWPTARVQPVPWASFTAVQPARAEPVPAIAAFPSSPRPVERGEIYLRIDAPAAMSAAPSLEPDLVFPEAPVEPEFALAAEDPGNPFGFEEPVTAPESAPLLPDFAPLEEDISSEAQSVRAQYIDLLHKKAELMSDEQILEALEGLTSDVNELEAAGRLEAIADELRSLVESHPGTQAAGRAETMLESMEAGDTPQPPTRSEPTVDALPAF